MTHPIETLMSEHRTIEKVLDAVEAAARKDVPSSFYERVLDFLAKYADGCHHAKEEDRLFPVLEQHGIPREGGPIGVMCAEHVLGRNHVKAMRACLEASDVEGLRRESLGYVGLLRQHIQKEDTILFTMARDVLTPDEVTRLEREFAEAQTSAACDADYGRLADELRAEAGLS